MDTPLPKTRFHWSWFYQQQKEEITMITMPSTIQELNKKRVKNIHGGESDNLRKSLRYMVQVQVSVGQSLFGTESLSFLGCRPCFPVPSHPVNVQPWKPALKKIKILSETEKQLDQEGFLSRPWHIYTSCNRTD